MPAAAVIPAPIAYIKIVAVKKLVVGFLAIVVLVRAFWVSCISFYLPSFRTWGVVRQRAIFFIPDLLL